MYDVPSIQIVFVIGSDNEIYFCVAVLTWFFLAAAAASVRRKIEEAAQSRRYCQPKKIPSQFMKEKEEKKPFVTITLQRGKRC